MLPYVKYDNAKVTRLDRTDQPPLYAVEKVLNHLRIAEVEFVVFIVESDNVFLEVPVAELKIG